MKYVLTLLLLCTQLAVRSQNDGPTLYAYEQKVIPGIAPARDVDEEGKEYSKPAVTKSQYYIYLTAAKNTLVYPVSLWIKGKQYGIHVKEAATPVKRQAANDSTLVLVPETGQKTIRLLPVPNATGKAQKCATLAKQNELVLVYKSRGQFYCITKEKFVTLSTVHMQ